MLDAQDIPIYQRARIVLVDTFTIDHTFRARISHHSLISLSFLSSHSHLSHLTLISPDSLSRKAPLDIHHSLYLLGLLSNPSLRRPVGQIQRPLVLDARHHGQ
jgi:hypothetical protein